MKITKKKIEIELRFCGDGRVIEEPPGCFRGGLPEPKLGDHIRFMIQKQSRHGTFQPILEGKFMINLFGDAKGYREQGRYLLALAELDTTQDNDFHEHHLATSHDGKTGLEITVRKNRERWFPDHDTT